MRPGTASWGPNALSERGSPRVDRGSALVTSSVVDAERMADEFEAWSSTIKG